MTRYSHITLVSKSLHWLSVQQRSVFKTARVVYKFIQSGYLEYFSTFLNPSKSFYHTEGSEREG